MLSATEQNKNRAVIAAQQQMEEVAPYLGGKFDYSQLKGYTPNLEMEDTLAKLSKDEISELIGEMTPLERAEFDRLLKHAPKRQLLPHQIVPFWRQDWECMLLVGGRGVGKTVCGSFGVMQHIHEFGGEARVGVGAPTNQDARDVCAEGETGLMTMFGHEFVKWNRSLGEARHRNGAYVKFMGTEKPKRWNGPQWSLLWFDELALCNQKAFDDANMGLRIGPNPRAIYTTTPKNRKWVKNLAQQSNTYVPHYLDEQTGKPRFPTTFDNPFLPKIRVERLKAKYLHTRLGRQELLGQFIEDVQGAKWNRALIRHETDSSTWPFFVRVVVAIDPAGSSARAKADENASEEAGQKNADTAISVIAKGSDGRLYVIAMLSDAWTPEQWARKAVQLFRACRADRIIAEKNFGGEMVESTIRSEWRDAPIKLVHASKGKAIRAEPVVAMYEKGRVVHCGYFGAGEDQMCAFVDADDNEGMDLVDSLVWGCLELMGLGDSTGSLLIGGDRWDALSGYSLIT